MFYLWTTELLVSVTHLSLVTYWKEHWAGAKGCMIHDWSVSYWTWKINFPLLSLLSCSPLKLHQSSSYVSSLLSWFCQNLKSFKEIYLSLQCPWGFSVMFISTKSVQSRTPEGFHLILNGLFTPWRVTELTGEPLKLPLDGIITYLMWCISSWNRIVRDQS